MKPNAKWLILGTAIVIASIIYACATRYSFSHYQGTTSVYDHWTGNVERR